MPVKDTFHSAVRNALEKSGWTITHDPFVIPVGKTKVYIDLGAEKEKTIAAEKGKEKIAVEIKSFSGLSQILDFHSALGQYLFYLPGLEEKDPERELFLGLPSRLLEDFLEEPYIRKVIKRYSIKVLIYDPINEIIVEWIR
ncbi:MAG: XisH family protein [Saprospiraceae bacterium]